MRAKIIYFSGTGNTEIITEKLSETLAMKLGKGVERHQVEDLMEKASTMDFEGQILGLGYPVYDFKPPEIVLDFIERLPEAKKAVPVFIYSTYTSLALDANTHAATRLLKKNYYPIATADFKAPGGVIGFYGHPESPFFAGLYRFEKECPAKVEAFVEEVSRSLSRFQSAPFYRTERFVPFNRLWQKASNMIYGNLFYRNLTVNGSCTGCGACSRKCPEGNITMINSKAEVKKKNGCLRCLRCVQVCPARAVNFTSAKRQGSYTRKQARELFCIKGK